MSEPLSIFAPLPPCRDGEPHRFSTRVEQRQAREIPHAARLVCERCGLGLQFETVRGTPARSQAPRRKGGGPEKML